MKTKNKFITIICNIILSLVGLVSGFFFLFGVIQSLKYLQMGKSPEFWDFFFFFFYGFTSYWCLKLAFTRGISTKRKREEEEHRQTIDSLRTAFGATIRVMVSAVESRDPYTAGHQIRSADLARAIATEMELSPDKIDGIRVAGSTHDIGKLSIPEEILSKPTNLSEMEFSLIKEHTQKGHEILKNVESPWPLAEIVYQHHERMDGSGYPRNLKGEEILIEARILAVADVVEAMASHRPYHPGLGIDAALEEIEKNKGILYDGTVADACLRLFREKGFKLEGT
jgi:HD-GYP domain-containing protein (c-di-GMP phosphodiesterase class II)